MTDPYGAIRKSPWSFLIFGVPAIGIAIVGVMLAINSGARGAQVLSDPTALICVLLGLGAVVWGVVFVRRPVVTLMQEQVVLPNGRSIDWSQISSAQEGQETTSAPSQSAGARSVTHEVVRLFHNDGQMTKITTTLAKIGPQGANDKILAAFENSRKSGA